MFLDCKTWAMSMTTIHSSVSNYTELTQREWRECPHQTVHMSSTFNLVAYHCLLPGKKCRSCMNSKLQHDSSMQNTPNLKCHKCWEILEVAEFWFCSQKISQRLSTHSRVSDKVGKHFCTSASAKHHNNFRMPKIGKSTSNLIKCHQISSTYLSTNVSFQGAKIGLSEN